MAATMVMDATAITNTGSTVGMVSTAAIAMVATITTIIAQKMMMTTIAMAKKESN